MSVKVKLNANLGWIDAKAYDMPDNLLAKCTEDAVVDVPERTAEILIHKIRCATAAPIEAKPSK